MPVTHRLREVLMSPPHRTVGRAARKARRKLDAWTQRRRDRNLPTYARDGVPEGTLAAWLPPLDVPAAEVDCDVMAETARHALAHRFDLLGSGWVEVRHGMRCRGVEGHRYDAGPAVVADAGGRWLRSRVTPGNRAEAQRLWSLIEPPYVPVDWHLDFKSGYRWSELTWHGEVPFGHRPGVDVKVPWELARLQHLPQLAATSAVLARAGHAPDRPAPGLQAPTRDDCVRLYRNQVLDFLATNPPRYGVNWRCTMDVAIRVANIVVARSLLLAAGARLDDAFESVLTRAVYEHGRFIVAHLEWEPILRSNHYLSNLVGLLFAAAHLPATRETDAWLAFGVQELIDEVRIQFGEDGANFEASTRYHRLSAEMVVFGTALVLGLPDARRAALATYDHAALDTPAPLRPAPIEMAGANGEHPFPAWYAGRVAGMGRFTAATMRSQIGDNDSGRFLRLSPACVRATVAATRERFLNLEGYDALADDDDCVREDPGDHRHLVEAIAALAGAPATGVDAAVVRGLARGRTLAAPPPAADPRNPAAFEDFGVWVYCVGRVRLVARAGSTGQRGNGGHAHNDQLSFELFVDDRPVIVDPGTYLYTPAPASRNLFRSTAMHNTILVPGREQNDWTPGALGLFSLRTARAGTVLRATATTWEAEFAPEGVAPRQRTIEVGADRLSFLDRCAHDGTKVIALHLHPDVEILTSGPGPAIAVAVEDTRVTIAAAASAGDARWSVTSAPYSDAYGWCRRGLMLELPFAAREVAWSVTIGER